MSNQYDNCTKVTDFCVVEATTYGYRPNLGANAFFLAIFAACLGVQFLQGLRWRTWTFMIAMTLGCLTEAIGYVGRIIMHSNPWSDIGFEIQICCIIIAPAFFSAAVYLTLKHLVLTLGSSYSRLPARWYTWIFIGCDLLSLIMQGAGGGTAASASTQSTQDLGSHLMLAGIIWQVVTLLIFAALATDFFSRAYRNRSSQTAAAAEVRQSSRFGLFLVALVTAYIGIAIRCIYRIAELAGGWGNDIMQNEAEFIVLEGVMIVVGALALTVFHPGHFFPSMSPNKRVAPNGLLGEKELSDAGGSSPKPEPV
ncbi:MAG: hypothetical protein LQ338_005236 [Usnochroma carphineum]|nr:MAG: hypothetical protein LQ338_005236 [Usnochroma carphineum]